MKIRLNPNYNLERLQHWLSYELSGSVLFFLTYAVGLNPLLSLLAVLAFVMAALALIPLLFKVLIQENKKGWIIFFFFFVAGPGFLSYHYFGQADWLFQSTIIVTAVSVSLMFFYFYCGLLKFTIPSWLHDEEGEYFRNEYQ